MFSKRIPSQRALELSLFLIVAGLTCMLAMIQGYKMVVLNLFHLPIVLAAFYLGRYRAGVLALVAVLLASAVAALDLEGFAATTSPLIIGLAITLWAAVIGLNAIFVGTLSDERNQKIQELHDAYVGVVEVLSHYLKSADRHLEHRSKRIADLSQRVAKEMHLSSKEVDDIRVAALLHEMNNIEVTAKVIKKAVGDLSKPATDEHTFQGSDLVSSLGNVLAGALPLILTHTDCSSLDFTERDNPESVDVPFGAMILRAVSDYDAFVYGNSSPMSPGEAINMMQSDLAGDYHPAVLHALQRVALQQSPAPSLDTGEPTSMTPAMS